MLNKKQLELCRKLYFTDIPLDEVAADYVKVIRTLLDTIKEKDDAIEKAYKLGQQAGYEKGIMEGVDMGSEGWT